MPFTDVDGSHPNFEAILYAQDMGIIVGYPDGSFQPDGSINRAELMKMVVEMNIARTSGDPHLDLYGDCFPDVTDQWFAPYSSSYYYYPNGDMTGKEVAETIFRFWAMENNGLAQYHTDYSPYGYSLDYGMRLEFGNKYGYGVDEVAVEFNEGERGFVQGMVVLGEGGPGQGGWFYGMVYEGGWVLVEDGNGVIFCLTLEENGFPESMMDGCYEE